MDYNTHPQSDSLGKIPEIIYICISEPTNGAKDLVKGKNIVYLLYNR